MPLEPRAATDDVHATRRNIKRYDLEPGFPAVVAIVGGVRGPAGNLWSLLKRVMANFAAADLGA
jgi:hypothetical protein